MTRTLVLGLALLWLAPVNAPAQYPTWKHSAAITILTTPEGANLPAESVVEDFPLLVRLDRDFFDFSQAKADGADLRFSSSAGEPLAYQIDEWDAAGGTASIWVRIPQIKGNARQEIRMHWGNAEASSQSDGAAVFNASNGYLSVLHMSQALRDEVGTTAPRDAGTTATAGVAGQARRLAAGQGIACGEKIASFPTGSSPHTTQVWFRATQPNGTMVAWGNEEAQGKVVMQYRSPPHVNMDCYFSGANVAGRTTIPMNQWAQVVHTYRPGEARLYVNGALDRAAANQGPPLAIRSPARMWIGGWYNRYDFLGDIDEVRVSNVARSADWIRLEYENQKPLETLVGPVVQPGSAFSVSPGQATVREGQRADFAAEAGGAQKVYWILRRGADQTVVATDRLHFAFDAGRVVGDETLVLQFKAICANEVKTRDIPITIREDIDEPAFTLRAPAAWDGRSTIEVVPQIANLAQMQAKGAGKLRCQWVVSDLAVIKEILPDRLILRRAQNSGQLTVTAIIDNGGQPTRQSATMVVTEPQRDAWLARTPAREEMPEENQFYARDDKNEGTLVCNGMLTEPADSVFLRVFADERPYRSASSKSAADGSYAFSVKLKPGLVRYRVEFGAKSGDRETVRHRAGNLVCGDAYLINGQSNAVSTDWGEGEPTFHSPWIRSFGSMSGDPQGIRLWGEAVYRSRDGEKLQIGYWGMELARRLVEGQQVPICIINGAVGGTRIDQHQRNPENPADTTTIYGRLLWRVREAKLAHGIRGIFWHQGENDQGADGPTGGFGWETYRQYFIDLAAAWKQDYPNVQHYYVFQIWPKACAMGVDGSDNRLREVQRQLPTAFSRLSVMSTLGIDPPGGCHYPAAGYVEMARLICPLVERDHYGKSFAASITPPDLKRAYYAGDARRAVVLEFDQPVKWDDALAAQFYLDGAAGRIASGSVSGNRLTLQLTAASTARTITYLDSKSWSPARLLRGENGIAALTFYEVPIMPAKPAR